MQQRKSYLRIGLAVLSAMAAIATAQADDDQSARREYEIAVTNITRDQQFTPLLTVVHSARASLFALGAASSAGLRVLAEEGNTAPLSEMLAVSPHVLSVATQPGLLGPGQTRTFTVMANGRFDRVTLAGMLIPTNDAFVAVTAIDLPRGWHTVTLRGVAYDSGTEANDERCTSIPGPFFTECGGPGGGAAIGNGEGFVHVHAGIHGVGDLMASRRDWRNPVVSVTVRRVR